MQVRGRMRRAWGTVAVSGAVAALVALTLPASGVGGDHKGKDKGKHAAGLGFKTSQPAMLTPLAPGSSVEPVINVGETLPSGYTFESIPDGIALAAVRGRGGGRGHGRGWGPGGAVVWVNHETSLVPFPIRTPPLLTESDQKNAELSELLLDRGSATVLAGRLAIPSSANYQRFCSNFLAGKKHGFERPLVLTNEEASDLVNRTGVAWPAGPGAEQAGVVVAYDPQTQHYRSIYSMGRMNHENAVALPGYHHPVVVTGDDTFTAPSSQLYLYSADSAGDLWNDHGALYAFKSSDPDVNDYGDLSGSKSVSGTFIPVPDAIARGDQTGLESWSNANGVFQFIRVEDIAYDRKSRRGERVVYFADTGEPRALPDPATGRLRRGPALTDGKPTIGPWPNGRIFKLVLDKQDPLKVKSLSILIDGDVKGAAGAGDVSLIHQPDNIETTKKSLLIQEDPGAHNQYAPSNASGTTARIWRYKFKTGALDVVARVNQSQDPAAQQGTWESSGIIDASKVFGKGWFLTNVQAHTVWIEQHQVGLTVFKKEAGQLLLLKIPGA
jgi:hypothetical protein